MTPVTNTITRRDAKRAYDTLDRKLDYTKDKIENWNDSPRKRRKALPYLLGEVKALKIALATLAECYDLDRPGDVDLEDERWEAAHGV